MQKVPRVNSVRLMGALAKVVRLSMQYLEMKQHGTIWFCFYC